MLQFNCAFHLSDVANIFGLLSGCVDCPVALGRRRVGRKSLHFLLSCERVSLQFIETPSTATHKKSACYTHCLLRWTLHGSGDSKYILVCKECADGVSLAARLLVCRPPAFGLTAAQAVALGIGGETPAGGRGRVVPKMAGLTDGISGGESDPTAAGLDSKHGRDEDDSGAALPSDDTTFPSGMAPHSGDDPPTIMSEDTAVAVVMDRLDALSASRAGNSGDEIRAPEGVRI